MSRTAFGLSCFALGFFMGMAFLAWISQPEIQDDLRRLLRRRQPSDLGD